MQDNPSNPQEGTGNLSQSDAVNLLLDTNSPSEEVSEVQPTTEVEAEDGRVQLALRHQQALPTQLFI